MKNETQVKLAPEKFLPTEFKENKK
jgi:hypothetical protein